MNLTREQILDFLQQHKQEMHDQFGVVKIGLFGSYARGDAHENSDVDVAIELSRNTADSYFGLLHFLEDSFNAKVDLGIESNFKPIIKPYIMREIVYV